jgi:hypothetical protein
MLLEQINKAFTEKDYTTEWLEDNADRKWDYNLETFILDDRDKIIGYKTGEDILEEIQYHQMFRVDKNGKIIETREEQNKKHFVLMLHKLPYGCIGSYKDGDAPEYMLYYA